MGLRKEIFCFNGHFTTYFKNIIELTHVCNYLKAYWLTRENFPTDGNALVS